MNIPINYASERELSFVIKGINEISQKEKEDAGPLRWLRATVKKAIRNKEVLIVMKDKVPIAFAWITFSKKVPYGIDYGEEKKFCWINWMYVSPGYRKKGIGTRLETEIEKECRKRNVRDIQLNIFPRSKSSLLFYREKGFKAYVSLYHRRLKS